jgi:predicted dehydrogenase
MQKSDGMMYAPKGKPKPVCKPGEFKFAVIGLDHGHIYGMCNGLIEAGATLVKVYDKDESKVQQFCNIYPGVIPAKSEEEVLEDPSIQLVAAAPIPCQRCPLGLKVMDYGKDYFADKPAITSLEQLKLAREKVKSTGKKFFIYFSERLHVEAAVYAGELIKDGVVGKVLQVIGLGPHRLNPKTRPDWFFDKNATGGILCDIGSHQIEQFLYYSGAANATVLHSKVANYNNSEYPNFEDFGDATLIADNGATHYFRVDWFTPDGLNAWGDGRTFILGTEGTIELRKYLDIARDTTGDYLYIADKKGERCINVNGRVGFPFFGNLIIDCLTRGETAMPQRHSFLAMELALVAQSSAIHVNDKIPQKDLLKRFLNWF